MGGRGAGRIKTITSGRAAYAAVNVECEGAKRAGDGEEEGDHFSLGMGLK